MARKPEYPYVLPTRFRLRTAALCDLGVHVFDNHWYAAACQVLRELRPRSDKKPRISLFNQAVLALSPVLAHGYRKVGYHPQGGERYQMLALEEYPGAPLVAALTRAWADVWLTADFKDLPSARVQCTAATLLAQVQEPGSGWQAISALDALQDTVGGIRYSALPSLLAACLAHSEPMRINGRDIQWGLLQTTNGLVAISAPQLAAPEATFAYLVRFSLQFQPGDTEPWINVALSCQRYMDVPVEELNRRRKATILAQLAQPLQSEWPHNATLIRLPIWPHDGCLCFSEGLHTLLDHVQARQLESDPAAILAQPLRYRQPDQDNYYVLYAEGYEPAHPLGTGFGAQERTEIFRQLCECRPLADLLTPAQALEKRFATSALVVSPWLDLEDRVLERTPRGLSPEQRSDFKKERQRAWRFAALQRAVGQCPVRFLLIAHTPGTAQVMQHFLERYFQVTETSQWPVWCQIEIGVIPDALFRPLNIEDTEGAQGERRLQVEQECTRQWQRFLQPYAPANESTYALAWIEIPESPQFTSIHDAVRAACVELGIASQMQHPLQSTAEKVLDIGKHFNNRYAQQDFGRITNAVGDLALRQTGVMLGSLPDTYTQAGFPAEIARDLVVIGLTRYRTNIDRRRGRGALDMPLAVRFHPDGRCEARLPFPSTPHWLPYPAAAVQLGRIFIQQRRRARLVLEAKDQRHFIQVILNDHREVPTLLLVDALQLRSQVWPMLQVGQLRSNTLALGETSFDAFGLADYPHLNVVWIREHGDGETPQYVATPQMQWSEVTQVDRIGDTALFLDLEASGPFQHFYSVGRLDNQKADQTAYRHDSGAKTHFKQQQMVELVPFFGTRPSAAVKVAHTLRGSPAWRIGDTVLPYPIHLANALIADMLPLLGVESADADEEADIERGAHCHP